jgi:hypothetical protein
VTSPPPTPIKLAGVPAGLTALLVEQHRTTEDGQLVPVRSLGRRRKVERVDLVGDGSWTGDVDELTDQVGETFLYGAETRRWATVADRLGEQAWPLAIDLARAGIVELRCTVNTLQLGEPQRWKLTPAHQQLRADRAADRSGQAARWLERATAVAGEVAAISPELADRLKQPVWTSTRPVLVAAAEDLVAGVVHDGPRAFSQAHFGRTKARDDVAQLLTAAGVQVDVLDRLGVRRSPRIGLAGPVTVHAVDTQVDVGALDGPVLLRADQPDLAVAAGSRARAVVIVENLQAAETLADRLADVIVVYTAGPPSNAALRLLQPMAGAELDVLIVPDADLGGVRIAERLLRVFPTAEVVDIGQAAHPTVDPWQAGGHALEGLQHAVDGPAGPLARACLARGYPVEQELATVATVTRRLAADPTALSWPT